MTYLLDTNALVWFETDDPRLGKVAARTISDAASAGLVSICPISFWEVELAIARRRITLSEPIAVWRRRGPIENLAVGRHQGESRINGDGHDQAVGGVGVEILQLRHGNGISAGDRAFDETTRQNASPPYGNRFG